MKRFITINIENRTVNPACATLHERGGSILNPLRSYCGTYLEVVQKVQVWINDGDLNAPEFPSRVEVDESERV